MNSFNKLYSQLITHSREYFCLLLVKRFFTFIFISLILCLFFSILDYFFNFSFVPRRTFAFVILIISIISLLLLLTPLLYLIINTNKRISEYIKIVQSNCSEINDSIVNIFELKEIKNDTDLITTSIEQKSKIILSYNYQDKVISSIKVRLKFIILIIILAISCYLLQSNLNRIIHYNRTQDYSIIITSDSKILFGQDLTIDFIINGDYIPDKIYLVTNNSKYLVSKQSNITYSYTFRNIFSSFSFKILIDNYLSDSFYVQVLNKPIFHSVKIDISYPKYTLFNNQQFNYFADINVPQGTIIKYEVISDYTDTVFYNTKNESYYFSLIDNSFSFQKTVKANIDFEVVLANKHLSECVANNKITVIPDEYPTISVGQFINDTTIVFNGVINDDYGFRKLLFVSNIDTIELTIDKQKQTQKFSYIAKLPNKTVNNNMFTYYFEVFDNDAVNGIKSTKSKTESIVLYSKTENEIANISNEQYKYQQVDNTTKTILSSINQLLQSRMFDNKLSWENKQVLDQINQQGENLNQLLSELKMSDNTLAELLKMLQLSDDKSLNKLLNKLKDIIESKQHQTNANNKLIDNLLKDKILSDIAEKMTQLADQHTDLQKIDYVDSLKSKFDDLKSHFDSIANQYNKTDDNTIKGDIEDLKNQYKSIENELNDNHLEQFEKQNSIIKQHLKSMAEKLQQKQNSIKNQQNKENADVLRQILDNLLQLSFNQENIIINLRPLSYSSNEYTNIITAENNMKEDFSFIKDSLYALASRTQYLGNFVFDNANQIDYNITESIDLLNDRRKTNALKCQNQVLKFTNDLISLLVESLERIDQSMSGEGNNNSSKRKQKPKNMQPSMSQMRNEQQNLEKQMQQLLQQMQQQGISENDILKLFSQTEMLKQKFDKFLSSNKTGNSGSEELKKIQDLIEKNRRELLNKRFDNQILNRQHQITTKMLDYEKAQEEREYDDKRKSKEAVDIEKKDVRDINNIIIFEDNEDVLQYKTIKLNTFYLDKYEEYIRNVNTKSNE